MNIELAEQHAIRLMSKHGLAGWFFTFDRAKQRFGLTCHGKKTISLSAPLTKINSDSQVIDTILHEIAHALVGSKHGHDNTWRQKAIQIGCNGQRCGGFKIIKTHRKPKHRVDCGYCGGFWYKSRHSGSLQFSWHTKCGKASFGQLELVVLDQENKA